MNDNATKSHKWLTWQVCRCEVGDENLYAAGRELIIFGSGQTHISHTEIYNSHFLDKAIAQKLCDRLNAMGEMKLTKGVISA